MIRLENKCFGKLEDFENEIKNFEVMYDKYSKMGLENNQSLLDSHIQPKKRGKRKQTRVKNLPDPFIDHKGEILRLMYDFEVPFENYQAIKRD